MTSSDGPATAAAPAPLAASVDELWQALVDCKVAEPKRQRRDLFLWRRGSAQLVLRVNEERSNLTIYSVLVSGATASKELIRYLLAYNLLQRRETLTLATRNERQLVVLKYTLELEYLTPPMLQRQILALQEAADRLDKELAQRFGGELHFENWNRLNQDQVDDLLGGLFD